ncbi:cytochrome P450 [Sphingomonas corticis]|uniref:Cytochrome P450 n=1 Tax=Sphingomonas corticis TaxID=2722791 RepID=A0ABX1CST8_9SPHN|nr:cytochrome P450 [Sphingomonas corticis]NJR80018.1 cytochrome P450 [Sphingomonas corticis]
MQPLLVPPFPYRSRDWPPVWTSFVGRRASNSVYGWPDEAFDIAWRTRRVLGHTVHLVSEPDAIGRVLLDNKANYERPALVRRLLRGGLGDGLFNAEGESWREQRRIVAPTFSPAAVAGFAKPIAHVVQEQVARWPAGTRPMDMAAEATSATMGIIAATLFGGDSRLTAPAAAGHITAMLDAAGRARLTALLGMPALGPGSSRARAGGRFLRDTLGALADERARTGGRDDFFGGLVAALHARYPAPQARELAVDNAVTFYVAGHETTANALTWTIYLLAAQPLLQETLRVEALAALGGDVETLDARLPRLRAVLDEALRLYPPAPRLDREAMADDELAGHAVRRGDLVSIWPYVLHRHRAWWDQPDAFDPERFLGDRRVGMHRYQYLPFGAGPRVCVGARFAVVEALIVLAHWLAARRFSLRGGPPPVPVGRVTLRPAGGMPLELAPV